MLAPLDLNQLAHRFDWHCSGPIAPVSAVSTDSRAIEAACVYVALQGERFDGHDYCQQAVAAGAQAVLVAKPVDVAVPTIIVKDTLVALGQLAQAQRELFNGTVFGLTGSAGKTTTKTLLAHIMASVASTCATQGNFNNEIGVPKTLFNLSADHQYAVIEMGAAGIGHIEYLATMVQPHIAIITNAAAAHIEGFGSLDGVAQGKGEIYQALRNGVAVINADSPYYDYWCGLAAGNNIVSFGLADTADVRASGIVAGIQACEFTVHYGGEQQACYLPLAGAHNVLNALAAIAAATAAGVSLAQAVQALAQVQAVAGRMQLCAGLQGAKLIDDSYNANPTAFERSIDTLMSQSSGCRWLIMGDMGELGESAADLHAHIGAYAKQQGVDRLWAVGSLSVHAAKAFGGRHFESQQALITAAVSVIKADDTLLIKGSRSAHMEHIVRALAAPSEREISC